MSVLEALALVPSTVKQPVLLRLQEYYTKIDQQAVEIDSA